MQHDVSLLKFFNLMDYSLLFVAAYNPEFIKRNKNLFKQDVDGNLIKPYQLEKPEKPDSST